MKFILKDRLRHVKLKFCNYLNVGLTLLGSFILGKHYLKIQMKIKIVVYTVTFQLYTVNISYKTKTFAGFQTSFFKNPK